LSDAFSKDVLNLQIRRYRVQCKQLL